MDGCIDGWMDGRDGWVGAGGSEQEPHVRTRHLVSGASPSPMSEHTRTN